MALHMAGANLESHVASSTAAAGSQNRRCSGILGYTWHRPKTAAISPFTPRPKFPRNPARRTSLLSVLRHSTTVQSPQHRVVVRASTETSTPAAATSPLQAALEKGDAKAVASVLDTMKDSGEAKLWKSYPNVARRSASIRELTQMGIKNAENLGAPSTRNEAAFLAAVVIPTSLLAVLALQLPGDWGFFVPYLVGGISFVVLGVGSVAPGLLQAPITLFGPAFSDYKERVLKHEAAHFLVAYLLGVPVASYSLDIGKEHTNLVDEDLQRRIYESKLEPGELDKLAVVAMAGMAAEGLNYDNVMGQTADLITLQRLINRSKAAMSNEQQQNLTRWAVLYASSLIKNNLKAFDSVVDAMKQGATVQECVIAIEAA